MHPNYYSTWALNPPHECQKLELKEMTLAYSPSTGRMTGIAGQMEDDTAKVGEAGSSLNDPFQRPSGAPTGLSRDPRDSSKKADNIKTEKKPTAKKCPQAGSKKKPPSHTPEPKGIIPRQGLAFRVMDSSSVERMQMLSDFIDMHYPSAEAKATLRTRGSYLQILPELSTTSCPVLRNAIRALCYAHIGSSRQDDRLVQQSQVEYGHVLRGISLSLQKPNVGVRMLPVNMMASILLLTLYDKSTPLHNRLPASWKMHYWGVHDYLKVRGPSAIECSEPFDQLFFVQLVAATTMLGISQRRPVVWNEPGWSAIARSRVIGARPRTQLNLMACPLPALLNSSDRLVEGTLGQAVLENWAQHAMSIRHAMADWSANKACFAGLAKWCELVTGANREAFDPTIEEHIVLSSSTAFDDGFFSFPSWPVMESKTALWLYSGLLDCTILRILHFFPHAEPFFAPMTGATVLQDAHDAVQNLCRSVYHLSMLLSQGFAGHLDACMALAENFYAEVGATKELAWVLAVRCATKVRIERLRESQLRSLCRMGDLADELGAVGRFRARNIKPNG